MSKTQALIHLSLRIFISMVFITLLFIIPRKVLLSSKMTPSTSQATHFLEIFRKSSYHVNTNKSSFVTQSGNDVEGCRSQKVLFQPNMRVFLQYSVKCCRPRCELTFLVPYGIHLTHISFQIKYNAACISNYTIPRIVQLGKMVL